MIFYRMSHNHICAQEIFLIWENKDIFISYHFHGGLEFKTSMWRKIYVHYSSFFCVLSRVMQIYLSLSSMYVNNLNISFLLQIHQWNDDHQLVVQIKISHSCGRNPITLKEFHRNWTLAISMLSNYVLGRYILQLTSIPSHKLTCSTYNPHS